MRPAEFIKTNSGDFRAVLQNCRKISNEAVSCALELRTYKGHSGKGSQRISAHCVVFQRRDSAGSSKIFFFHDGVKRQPHQSNKSCAIAGETEVAEQRLSPVQLVGHFFVVDRVRKETDRRKLGNSFQNGFPTWRRSHQPEGQQIPAAGTGSIGRAFEELGWEVTSLDVDRKASPIICADTCSWEPLPRFAPGYFDMIWASPVCTE